MRFAALLALVVIAGSARAEEEAQPRPNILWLSSEDMSANLGCYGDPDAITPNIDQLAADGVRYTHAFTAAPVCAPNRSSVITGMYPTSLGTHHMRSSGEGIRESRKPALPDSVRCFPEYLRAAGYYCTNNVKEDYNFAPTPAATWDESSETAHWEKRPNPEQPFFAVFNYMGTHEGQVRNDGSGFEKFTAWLTPEQRHDPEKVRVPPYHPDTPAVRRQWANYHDLVTSLDLWVAEHLLALEKAGLADNTIVVFWSDHGTGLPRHKRWLYDSGTHIPLIVRAPRAWQERLGLTAGTVNDRLISSVDLAPSMLNLAGVAIPAHMQGRPFLGAAQPAPREYAYSARDRMDERYDVIRSVRDRRFRYIRNFQPWVPYHQHIDFCERGDVQKELRRLKAENALPEGCAWFGLAQKPDEELYDMEADPHSLTNLAADPVYAGELERLRMALNQWMRLSRDLGFIPESELNRLERQFGSRHAIYEGMAQLDPGFWRALHAVVRVAGSTAPQPAAAFEEAFQSRHTAIRYWGVVGAGRFGPKTPDDLAWLQRARLDPAPEVRLAAAEGLLRAGADPEAQIEMLTGFLKDEDMWVRLLAATALDGAGAAARAAEGALREALNDQDNKYVVRVANHTLNTLNGTTNEVR